MTKIPVYREDQPWYHGSPLELSILRTGSTVTQDKNLARIFSHKPTIVICEDDGKIKHNGRLSGYLYVVDEPITLEDIYPHPQSSMEPGEEWLTRREIKIRLINQTEVMAEEQLSDCEIAELKMKLEKI